jgi:PAS domain S-box-containing protein
MTAPGSLHNKELEAALMAERAYTHALLQSLPVGVCTVDGKGRIVSLNSEGERLLGWSQATCTGSDLHELIGCRVETGDAEQEICPIWQVIETGKPAWATHTFIRCRNGTDKLVEYKCLPLVTHRDHGAIFSFRDLSRQFQLEKDLLRLASMPEESPGPIVELDAEASIIYANGAMMSLMDLGGFTPEGFPSTLPSNVARITRLCLDAGESVKGVEVAVADKLFEWTFFPLREIGLVRGFGIDLTERQQAEQELKRARDAALEVSRVKSEFLANVSHELRTPLNGIIGMTELTLDSDISPQQREYLDMVKGSADTLLTLINDILDFSKIEVGKLSFNPIAFGLRQSLGEALKPLALRAHQKGLELIYEIPSEVPDALIGDPVRFRQIIVNLIDNAIKFTDQGEVLFSVNMEARRDHDVCLHVTVTDTGVGIPEEHQHRIFDPFMQADGSTTRIYGGTGLGLAIVGELVAMMGGELWVESAGHGTGSVFHFTAQVGLQSGGTTVSASLPVDHPGLPVLVVTANPTSRRVLTSILQDFDLSPTAVKSAQDALIALEHTHNTAPSFALIVLDAHLPEMDGFDLARRLKQQWADIPLLMLITTDQKGKAEKQAGLEQVEFLTKPVLASDLEAAIITALQTSQPDSKNALLSSPAVTTKMGKGLRILLAEDNIVNQKVVMHLLEKHGYTVGVAGSGKEALTVLAKQPFDLVFMDVQMPEMDGLETTMTIRSQEQSSGRHLPIIALTANAMPGDRERCLKAGATAILVNPLSLGNSTRPLIGSCIKKSILVQT